MNHNTNFDPFSPTSRANPYPAYAQLRQEAPLLRLPARQGGAIWLVTRYEDAVIVLKDPRMLKDWRNLLNPQERANLAPDWAIQHMLSAHMLNSDPPDHTRLRRLVQKVFTPAVVEQLRPRIQMITDDLIDQFPPQDEFDLLDNFAFPLPITVISELLGVPIADRDHFRQWSNAIISGGTDPQIGAAVQGFVAYLQALFAQRRRKPTQDLISDLVQVEEAGDRLTEGELFGMVFLLIVAGHETTVNLIGNGMLALLQHPDQLTLLRQQPNLIASAIEELLRFNGPVEIATTRFASEVMELGGQQIERGDQLIVSLASADHDENRFAQPEELDITRTNNRHLAFGHGIHYCLGAPLARVEGEIAITTLLRRLPDLRLAVDPATLQWRPGLVVRGLQRFPITVGSR